MKKTIVILTILLSSLTATAQEKRNDATWEETIDFILKYKNKISKCEDTDSWEKVGWANYIEDDEVNEGLKILDYKYLVMRKNNKDRLFNFKYNLEEINEIDFSTRRRVVYVKFTPTQKLSFKIPADRDLKTRTRNYKHKSIGFYIETDDSEFHPRLLKAFEHLAYLARKKREEARKASGDKF